MLCFMKKKKFLFPSLLFLFSVLLSSVFINSGNSFASSVSCSSSITSNSFNYTSGCDLSSLDSSAIWFYYIIPSSSIFSSPNFASQNRICFYDNLPCSSGATTSQGRFVVPINISSTSIFSSPFIFSDYGSQRFLNFGYYISSGSLSENLVFTFTISDSNPFLSAPTGNLDILENGTYDVSSYATATVNVENEVIYGDYHNDLITINNSILTCGAICLVIYFFYCIYRIIIKNSGVK